MRNYSDLLRQRVEIRERCEVDLEFRKEILLKCYKDSVFWCDNFGTTFDPRESNRTLPFILWDKQIEYIRWLEDLIRSSEDGLIEKSRDVGASYTTLAPVICYQWLFHDFNALIGSRVANKVDKSDDPDALFWKIDFCLRNLPEWMLPKGFNWNEHRTYMRLSRPDNENVIVGESSNANFGRAGRYNLALFDEHGFWMNAKSAWESSGSSATTRLSISTPPETGKASYFYKLRVSGRVRVFTFHYKDDPRRDEEWEAKQRSKQSPEEFERERNISYSGSLENKVYATEFSLVPQGRFVYDSRKPLYVSWDFGLDMVAMQWYQWNIELDRWVKIDSYANSNKDIEFYVPFITGEIVSEKALEYDDDDLIKIMNHTGWKGAIHFGDPDVNKRSILDKRSTKGVLASHGIHVQSKAWAGRSHYDMRQQTLMFLKKLSIDDSDEFFNESIMLSSYPEKSETSQSTSETRKPIHNIYSHHRTALEYMADNAPEKPKNDSRPPRSELVDSNVYN